MKTAGERCHDKVVEGFYSAQILLPNGHHEAGGISLVYEISSRTVGISVQQDDSVARCARHSPERKL